MMLFKVLVNNKPDTTQNGCNCELQPKNVVGPDITQKGDNPELSPNKVISSLAALDKIGGSNA